MYICSNTTNDTTIQDIHVTNQIIQQKVVLKINKKFQREYNRVNELKDLDRAKQTLTYADLGDSSSSDESEDSDAEELTLAMDTKIHELINKIRNKDESIYSEEFKPFEDVPEESLEKKKPKKKKELKYKDMVAENAC